MAGHNIFALLIVISAIFAILGYTIDKESNEGQAHISLRYSNKHTHTDAHHKG